MKTKRFSDRTRDILSLIGRIVNFYKFFNQRDRSRCYEYIDPKLRDNGRVAWDDSARALHAFFEAHGPIQRIKILQLSPHSGRQAKTDQRDFAYVVIF